MIFLSARESFGRWSEKWEDYKAFVGLPGLSEVRSVDPALNPFIRASSALYCGTGDPLERLNELPQLEKEHQYYQVVVLDPESEDYSFGRTYRLLGYDLLEADVSSGTSSLLNCGAWKGRLEELSNRRNDFGLLSFYDALQAQKLLPEEWGPNEHHAIVGIRAVFELNRLSGGGAV